MECQYFEEEKDDAVNLLSPYACTSFARARGKGWGWAW
jgi:hypothetical protein